MWQMIKSFPRLDKMKLCHHWTSKLFVMAVLCLTLNADNETCEDEIKVRRQKTYKATLGQLLRIVCPVRFCNGSIPTISWFKLETNFVKLNFSDRVRTEWTGNNQEGESFLIFNNVQSRDLGVYHCRFGIVVSHLINVTLKDDNVTGTFQDQNATSTDKHHDNRHLWLYLYTTVGIVGIVIIVTVISVLSIRGCKGTTKNEAQSDPYMDIPMVEQPVHHHSSHQTLPRASPRAPPSHRTSRKKKSSSAPLHTHNVYGQMQADRHRNDAEEEGSSVVYAALNHQHLATASPRPRTVTEETSEYAAIKVS